MPVTGLLKGYDTLVNLVLDETKEFLRGNPPVYPACPYPASAIAADQLIVAYWACLPALRAWTACRPDRPLQAVCAHARTGPDGVQGQLGDAHLPGRRHRGDPQPVPQERRADLIVTSCPMHSRFFFTIFIFMHVGRAGGRQLTCQ